MWAYFDRDTFLLLIAVSVGFWLIVAVATFYFIRRLMQMADIAETPPHTFKDWQSQYLECDGETIHYVRVGTGPDLVLLHGIGASLFVWRYIIEKLAQTYTVTALDLPGFGRSSKHVQSDYGLDSQHKRLLHFLDKLDVDKAVLVGSSMGGTLALWLANHSPDRFEKVAVLAPSTDPTFIPKRLSKLLLCMPYLHKSLNRVTMNLILRQVFSRQELVARETIQTYLEPYLDEGVSVKTFLAAMELLGDRRLPHCFSTYKKPVLILYGARDRMVFSKSIARLQDLLPDSRLFVHPNSGHHIMEDEPEWCTEKILEFLT